MSEAEQCAEALKLHAARAVMAALELSRLLHGELGHQTNTTAHLLRDIVGPDKHG